MVFIVFMSKLLSGVCKAGLDLSLWVGCYDLALVFESKLTS